MEGNHGAYGPLSLIGLDRWRVFCRLAFHFSWLHHGLVFEGHSVLVQAFCGDTGGMG